MSNLSIGTWMSLPNESIAEIYANTGYEWIVVDLEHSAMTIHQAEKLIRIIDLCGTKPYVRLSGHDPSQIKRVLDSGAKGIIAPMVNSYDEAADIIKAIFYPPRGTRGMGLARAQGYGGTKKEDYIKSTSNEIEIFVQIESIEALIELDRIFELPIEGYFFGPYDLSASLGKPGDFSSKEFSETELLILEKAKAKNLKACFHLVEPEPERIPEIEAKGYNMLAYSVDIRILERFSKTPFK